MQIIGGGGIPTALFCTMHFEFLRPLTIVRDPQNSFDHSELSSANLYVESLLSMQQTFFIGS